LKVLILLHSSYFKIFLESLWRSLKFLRKTLRIFLKKIIQNLSIKTYELFIKDEIYRCFLQSSWSPWNLILREITQKINIESSQKNSWDFAIRVKTKIKTKFRTILQYNIFPNFTRLYSYCWRISRIKRDLKNSFENCWLRGFSSKNLSH